MSNTTRVLREDEFVLNVVHDPREPPDVLFFMGFIGRAPEQGETRIYLDVQLAAYVDLPSGEILYAEPLPRSQSPVGGHYLWVLRNAATMEKLREANRRLTQVQQETALEFQLSSGALGGLPTGWPTPSSSS
jgi:hypothetical protein